MFRARVHTSGPLVWESLSAPPYMPAGVCEAYPCVKNEVEENGYLGMHLGKIGLVACGDDRSDHSTLRSTMPPISVLLGCDVSTWGRQDPTCATGPIRRTLPKHCFGARREPSLHAQVAPQAYNDRTCT